MGGLRACAMLDLGQVPRTAFQGLLRGLRKPELSEGDGGGTVAAGEVALVRE